MNGRQTGTTAAALAYIAKWKQRGYERDIPQECPRELSSRGIAPSYRAICLAILQNDLGLKSISPRADWRDGIKRTASITNALGVKKENHQEAMNID